jgi:signal transduction histidine kinase
MRCGFWVLAVLVHISGAAEAAEKKGAQKLEIKTLRDLRQAVTMDHGRVDAYAFDGTVLAADAKGKILFLQDPTGTEVLELDFAGRNLEPGQKIRLHGTNLLRATAAGFSLGKYPAVENDGLHSAAVRQGKVRLKKGKHPIRIVWFNHKSFALLEASYEGPNLTRRRIPPTAFFRREGAGRSFLPGLNFRAFEGAWQKLPDFSALAPVAAGVAPALDVKMATRPEDGGLEFTGWLDIPEEGIYTFYLNSDDGSRMFIEDAPPSVENKGRVLPPAPAAADTAWIGANPEAPRWSEMEGTVSFLGKKQEGAEVELDVEESPVRLQILQVPVELPRYLLRSRLRVRGLLRKVRNTEGQLRAAWMLAPHWQSVRVLEVAPEHWNAFKTARLGELLAGRPAEEGLVRILGRFRAAENSGVELADETGSVAVALLGERPALDTPVECLGRWSRENGGFVLREAVFRPVPPNPEKPAGSLPLLSTAVQVQQLKPEETRRGYPVKIQGVVTWVAENHSNMVLQDATRGVFILGGALLQAKVPAVGEYYEIEGLSAEADFSPVVRLRYAVRRGMGKMPAPLQPTLQQLLNGSLDAQYVEIRGFATAAWPNHLALLVPGGSVDVELYVRSAENLETYVNSLVRIRGCLFGKWDKTNRIILERPFWLGHAVISIDAPAPLDPFEADPVQIMDLRRFDVQNAFLRRAKISGQILHRTREGMYYLTDGTSGLRFFPASPLAFDAGDRVEVVGLVELGGLSPLLHQAVARKVGTAPLAEPRPVDLAHLKESDDASRVWVEALLIESKENESEYVLEMQAGLQTLIARVLRPMGVRTAWAPGSRLKVVGVLAGPDPRKREDSPVRALEILVASPANVVVIARPPWWTLERLLVIVALMAAGLALALLWIHLLRRQVERRTAQWRREISEREKIERSQAVEEERARIARDLHDDLGSNLTEISMLATPPAGSEMKAEMAHERLHLIADKSRFITTALDELVWAVNPKNDTLAALAEYLVGSAEEFLTRMKVVCRIELPAAFPACLIMAEARHHILLSVKEVLHNAVRHGRPAEVLLRLVVENDVFQIFIQDNGCGFDSTQSAPGNGLENLRVRMRKLDGQCQVHSSPGRGTQVLLSIPLPADSASFLR